MNLATALLAEIKERGLDELFSTEEAISRQTTATILETLRSNKAEPKPTTADKLRLVLVYYMSAADGIISKDDITELEAELKNAGADTRPFEYLRRTKEIMRMSVPAAPTASQVGPQGELFRGFSVLGSRVRISYGSQLIWLIALCAAYQHSGERWRWELALRREELPSGEQVASCHSFDGSANGSLVCQYCFTTGNGRLHLPGSTSEGWGWRRTERQAYDVPGRHSLCCGRCWIHGVRKSRRVGHQERTEGRVRRDGDPRAHGLLECTG
jgi:Sec1 family